MFVTNWISTTKIQKISKITNFFRHYFLSRTEVISFVLNCYFGTKAIKIMRNEMILVNFNTDNHNYSC